MCPCASLSDRCSARRRSASLRTTSASLKTAFLSFRPFEELTVAEVFAEHPEWEKEIEEDLRKHKWGEE